MRRAKKLVVLLMVLWAVPVVLYANPGVQWLSEQTNPDGSQGLTTDIATSFQATPEVLRAYHAIDEFPPAGISEQLSFIDSEPFESTEYLARKIIAKSENGADASALLSKLLTYQNPDGGFGDHSGFSSTVLDTAFALDALVAVGNTHDEGVTQVVTFLLSTQQADGHWQDSWAEPAVYTTALALQALAPFESIYIAVSEAMHQGTTYLIAQRTADGLWGETYLSAQALLAIVPYLHDLTPIETSMDLFLATQGMNGSWQDDVYQTAVALRAAHAIALATADLTLGAITGEAIAGHTGLPLAGVTITLTGASTAVATSNTYGQFTVTQIAVGEYDVALSFPNYNTVTASVIVAEGQTVSLGSVSLTQGELTTTGTVQGLFTHVDTGAALPGVVISVLDTTLTATSAADGRYQIANVPAGSVALQASKAGYSTANISSALSEGGLVIFSATLTPVSEAVTAIEGVIVDQATNTPVAGATVTLSGNTTASTTTDALGAYQIGGLNSGALTVDVSAIGYDSLSANTTVYDNNIILFSPKLYAAGTQPVDGNTASITGRVVDAASSVPISGATVSAIFGAVTHTAITDAAGVFNITGLTEFDGQLNITMPAYLGYAVNVTLAPLAVLETGDIRLYPEDVTALLPDLTPTTFDTSGVVVDLTTLHLAGESTVIIQNLGASISPAGIELVVYHDSNQDGVHQSDSDTVLGYLNVVEAIASGAELSVNVPLAGFLPYRDAPLSVWLDSEQVVVETDESNNHSTIAHCTAPGIDLTAARLQVTRNPFGLSVRIGNAGSLASPDLLEVSFYEGNPTAGGTLLGRVPLNALAANTFQDVSLQSIILSGTQNVSAVVDHPGSVSECDEGNNTVSIPSPTLQPDLLPTVLDNTNATTDPHTLALSGVVLVTVANEGTQVVNNPVDVVVYYDANGNGSYEVGSDTKVGQTQILTGLGIDSTVDLSMSVSGELPFRDAPLNVWVDSLEATLESREDNNTLASSAMCKGEIFPIGAIDPVVKWHWTGPSIDPSADLVLGPVVVGQLSDDNGDGFINTDDTPDIVFPSHRGWTSPILNVVSGADGSEVWSKAGLDISAYGSPSLGDIDGDGIVEIVFVTNWRTHLVVLEHDGTLKWKVPITPRFRDTPRDSVSIADINADGTPELIIGRQVYDANGNLLWEGSGDYGGETYYGVVSIVADIDLDGNSEVIAGRTVYDNTGSVKWHANLLGDGFNAVGNFDDDDDYAEIVHVGRGQVHLLEHTGAIKWGPVSIEGGSGGAPVIADFDGDGEPEIGVMGVFYYSVIETNGTVKWRSHFMRDYSSVTSSSVFDFNGDGEAEVLYADQDNFYIFEGSTGSVVFSTPNKSFTTFEYPVVADIDNDGQAEIMVGANYARSHLYSNGLRVFESASGSWMPTRSVWNQHAYHITNVNDDGMIPSHEQPSWLTHNTYRANALIERDTLGQPDLTASLLAVLDNGASQPLSLSVRVGNAGAASTSGAVMVAFYNGDPTAGGILLGTVASPSLAAGAYADVQLDGVSGIGGSDELFVVVDPDSTYAECDETNNRMSSFPGSALTGQLSVTTNTTEYGPDSAVLLNGVITNPSALTGQYQLQLAIEDAGGVSVATFIAHTVSDLLGGGETTLGDSWNTGSVLAGSYTLRGTLTLADGTWLDEATASFTISHSATATSVGSVTTYTDLPTYHTTASAQMEQVVQNTTTNAIIDHALVRTTITDPDAATVFTHEHSLGQLGIGAQRTLYLPYAFSAAVVGVYTITTGLWDGHNNQLLASDTTDYTVFNDLSIALSSAVSATVAELYAGDAQGCTSTLTNSGDLALTAVNLRSVLVDMERSLELEEVQWTRDFSLGESQSLDQSFVTSDWGLGQHACITQAQIDGSWQNMAYAVFVVLPNPNTPPVSHAGYDHYASLGEVVTLDGSASTDVDGNSLTYSWQIITAPAGSIATLSDATQIMPAFTVDVAGDYVIELIVDDGLVASEPDTVTIALSNVAPVADAGTDQVVSIGSHAQLNGTHSSDVDGDPLSFLWSLVEVPAGSAASLSDSTLMTPTLEIDLDGGYIVQLVVNDGVLDSEADTVELSTYNLAPVAHAGLDQTVSLGDTPGLDGTLSHDANGDLLTYRWHLLSSPEGSTALLTDEATATPALGIDVVGTYVVQLIVNDGLLDSAPDTVVLDADNTRPVADAGPDQTDSAGIMITLDGSASHDAQSDPLFYRWHFTTLPFGASLMIDQADSAVASYNAYIAGRYIGQLIVDDGTLPSLPDTTVIDIIDDVGPITQHVEASLNPVDIHTGFDLIAQLDDSTTGGATIAGAEYRIEGSAYTPMAANDGAFNSMSETAVIALPAFGNAGVYELCVRAIDSLDNAGMEECTLLAVYDPEGGFVTGGGWINSPAGACQLTADCTAAIGKANFGFVSKYKKGANAPTGNTNFVFKSGGIHFRSDSYQWLVVAGAKAMFKGEGAISNGGQYGFLIKAIDESLTNSTSKDTFRIKIWDINDADRVVYDNEIGADEDADPSTEIGGGSIVIHKQ